MTEKKIQNIQEDIENFVKNNAPLIIVNIATGKGLVCLSPKIEKEKDYVMIKFESLNERGGNSIRVQGIHSEEGEDTIYLETDEDNIIMLQKLDTANYLEYIKKEYFNAPTFTSEKDLLKYIDSFMA